jgi:hypothetical protein
MPSYYNNFFISNVTRWLEPDIQDLLSAFDETGTTSLFLTYYYQNIFTNVTINLYSLFQGMIFLDRWNDLSIQSAVVKLLIPDEQIHRFTGWAYAHHSGNPKEPFYGIIQSGVLEKDQFKTIFNFAQSSSWDQARYYTNDWYKLVHSNMLTLSTSICLTEEIHKLCCLC